MDCMLFKKTIATQRKKTFEVLERIQPTGACSFTQKGARFGQQTLYGHEEAMQIHHALKEGKVNQESIYEEDRNLTGG